MAKTKTGKSGRPRKKKEENVNEQAVEQTATEQQQEETVAADVDELPKITEEQTADEQAVKESAETEKVQTEEQVQEPQPEPVGEELQKELEEQEKERTKQRRKEFMAEMNKVPEADTREMLDFLGITELPQFTNAEADLWVKGVARVRKRDTSVSWCVVERRGVEKFGITKIFGRCSPIAQVGVVIPIEVMNPRFKAKVNRYSISSVRNFVAEKIGERAAEMSDEEIMDELVRIEIEFYNNSKYFGDE